MVLEDSGSSHRRLLHTLGLLGKAVGCLLSVLGQLLSPAEGRATTFSLSCFSRCPRVQEGSASVPVRLEQPPATQPPAPRLLHPQPLCSVVFCLPPPRHGSFPCWLPVTSDLWSLARHTWPLVPGAHVQKTHPHPLSLGHGAMLTLPPRPKSALSPIPRSLGFPILLLQLSIWKGKYMYVSHG